MEWDTDFRPGAPIWQGDLLGFGDWDNSPVLERFGVVITADCDIQRARPQQSLVYLRIVSQRDYLDVFWSREKLERERQQALTKATQMINRIRRMTETTASELALPSVERWISTAPIEEICDAIGTPDENREQLSAQISNARTLLGWCQRDWGTSCMTELATHKKQNVENLLKRAAGELSQLRDSLFFLSGIKEQTDDLGYYVLLDQIGAVRLDQISDSLAEVRRGEKRAYRFGCVSKPYKYALAQRFAALFQRIGLPSDYNARHSKGLDGLAAPLAEGDPK